MSMSMLVIVGLLVLVVILALAGIRQVPQGQAAVIERLGRYHKTLHPGVNLIVPFFDHQAAVGHINRPDSKVPGNRIDMREQVLDVPAQQVITKDNVQMKVDTVVFYQVSEPYKAFYEVAQPVPAIFQVCKTTVRSVFGELDLDASLASRELVNARLRTVLDEVTDKWGIKVMRVEIQDIVPPQDLIEVMKLQMEAERNRRASVTAAEGEKQAKILVAEGEAESIRLVQTATARGLDAVRAVLGNAEGAEGLLTLQTLKAQENIAKELASGAGTKLYLPTSLAGFYGAIDGVKEMLKVRDSFGSPEKAE